jgi:carbonic anhydrase/acetyltransferase-like protein (isoleucine patch superfamily)
VGLGVILTISGKNPEWDQEATGSTELAGSEWLVFLDTPLELIELVGCSVLERLIERFVAIEVQCISVLAEASSLTRMPLFRAAYGNVTVKAVKDVDSALRHELASFAQKGITHAFVNSANAYTETDLLDLFCFHRESRQPVTRTFDNDGPLDLSVVDCSKLQRAEFETSLKHVEQNGAPKYFIREYVNRLLFPWDLRRLAADILRRSCETTPCGRQVRPGVWIDQGGEVHRRARIVAPAYIGCGSKIRADALVTRFSDIERDCCIDSGTVIEDSSILANTTIGICLDLCHAVASGNQLWNLERDVAVEIVDPKVMRFTTAPRRHVAHTVTYVNEPMEVPEDAVVSQKPTMPDTWQFGNNVSQE